MPRPSDPGRPSAARPAASAPARLRALWAQLPGERRLAALACAGLFLSLFLPWYQVTVIARGVSSLHQLSTTFTGWGAFSFVEAAVLLVAVGVLVLLFLRADGRPFHVPGGDGGVVTAAGGWTCVLLIWRMFDKQGTTGFAQYATTSGVEWGIFVALIIAGVLAYAGTRIRLAHDPEPPLPGSDGYLGPAAAERAPRRRRRGDSRRGRRETPGRRRPAPSNRDWSDGGRTEWAGVPRDEAGDRGTWTDEDRTQWSDGDHTGWSGGERSDRPDGVQPPSEPATEPLVQRLRPPNRPRSLARDDLGELGLDEPPTSPLEHRPGPPRGSAPAGADEPLTTRLDDE